MAQSKAVIFGSSAAVLALFLFVFLDSPTTTEATAGHGHGHGGYGHGHGHSAGGTACIVKGSYCSCHYCKCEKGHISCKGHGHGGYGKRLFKTTFVLLTFSFLEVLSHKQFLLFRQEVLLRQYEGRVLSL